MSRKSVIKFHHIMQFFHSDYKLIQKGENAVESNHIKGLNYDDDKKLLESMVEASMKDKVYKVQVTFEIDGGVKKATCDCPRGLVGCHHMAAALIYAHHNVSITDKACRWNFKKTANKNSVVTTVDELFPMKPHKPVVDVDDFDSKEETFNFLKSHNQAVGFTWL